LYKVHEIHNNSPGRGLILNLIQLCFTEDNLSTVSSI